MCGALFTNFVWVVIGVCVDVWFCMPFNVAVGRLKILVFNSRVESFVSYIEYYM